MKRSEPQVCDGCNTRPGSRDYLVHWNFPMEFLSRHERKGPSSTREVVFAIAILARNARLAEKVRDFRDIPYNVRAHSSRASGSRANRVAPCERRLSASSHSADSFLSFFFFPFLSEDIAGVMFFFATIFRPRCSTPT